ncbi:hypothetical protein [Streptosporangium sp. CA-115845]|uniref:hypothetical protein n=1 Tax=Streptosporangium sp. CA-115845 TaxID=3240071 RepID=UPI003D93D9F0
MTEATITTGMVLVFSLSTKAIARKSFRHRQAYRIVSNIVKSRWGSSTWGCDISSPEVTAMITGKASHETVPSYRTRPPGRRVRSEAAYFPEFGRSTMTPRSLSNNSFAIIMGLKERVRFMCFCQ